MKRACDRCIIRKVKCDGDQPCQRCKSGRPELTCSYLKLARKRGPKSSRNRLFQRASKGQPRPKIQKSHSVDIIDAFENEQLYVENEELDYVQDGDAFSSGLIPNINHPSYTYENIPCHTSPTVYYPDLEFNPLQNNQSTIPRSDTEIPLQVLQTVLESYRSRMYPVWPVVDVDALEKQLQQSNTSPDIYVLATSLCAATMAQLHLSPVEVSFTSISSQDMERECNRARLACDYREEPSLNQVLVSFFLHVYHAKIDRQKAALLYVQESLSLARLLNLADDASSYDTEAESPVDKRILYLLLWVSERGYAIQYALPISSHNTISLPSFDSYEGNIYVQGLINLATLFVAFDTSSIPQFSRYGTFSLSTTQLVTVEKILKDTPLPPPEFDTLQRVDFLVTKQWMRLLLWQQAMSRGLLSSTAGTKSMSFSFPAQIAKDLLGWMVPFSTDSLMPLGRDQLVKLFEITNTLADVILCNPQMSLWTRHWELGPPDFLHALYQTMTPLLELDPFFSSMLREKIGEALLRAPSRVFALSRKFDAERDSEINVEEIPAT